VEASLVLVTFLVTMIGLFDLSSYLFLTQSIEERVRQALRYGTVRPYNAQQIQDIVLYGITPAAAGQQPSFHLTRPMVHVAHLDAGTANERLEIVISDYQYHLVTPVFFGRSLDTTIKSSLPYEGL